MARVRGFVFHENKLMLIRREKSNLAPYWVFPGGGVEPDDASFEHALTRELQEELGASGIHIGELAWQRDTGADVEYYFVVTIESWAAENRCGPEFQRPENGLYDICSIGISDLPNLNIKPVEALPIVTTLYEERNCF